MCCVWGFTRYWLQMMQSITNVDAMLAQSPRMSVICEEAARSCMGVAKLAAAGLELCKSALAFDGKAPVAPVFEALAASLLQGGQIDLALDAAMRALQLNARLVKARETRAEVYKRKEMWKERIADLEYLLNSNPQRYRQFERDLLDGTCANVCECPPSFHTSAHRSKEAPQGCVGG